MQDIKFFPRNIQVKVTEETVSKFIEENFEDFMEYMFRSHGFAISEYIDDAESVFSEFVLCGGAAE